MMLSGTIKLKTMQQTTAVLEVVGYCYFENKQLICYMVKNNYVVVVVTPSLPRGGGTA